MEPDRGSRPHSGSLNAQEAPAPSDRRSPSHAMHDGSAQVDELVLAGPPSARRRLGKRFRRIGTVLVIAFVAVMGLGLTLDRLYPLPDLGSGGASVVVAADGTP